MLRQDDGVFEVAELLVARASIGGHVGPHRGEHGDPCRREVAEGPDHGSSPIDPSWVRW
jgi:hypothetical protein